MSLGSEKLEPFQILTKDKIFKINKGMECIDQSLANFVSLIMESFLLIP